MVSDNPPPSDDPEPLPPPLPFDSDLFDEYVVSFGPTNVLADTTTISNGVTLWQNGAGGTVSNLVLGTMGASGTVILDMDASAGMGLTVLGTLDIRSPVAVRAKYKLYDNKICLGEESAQCRGCLERRVATAGYRIVTDRGDVRRG